MKSIKKKFIIFVATILLLNGIMLVSCQKEEITKETAKAADTFSSERTAEHVLPEDAILLENNTLECSTEGVALWNGMLFFQDSVAFARVMSTLVNQSSENLNAWEARLNFTSMRSFYEATEEDPYVDDEEIDNQRIPDEFLETILNSQGFVRIGDRVYQVSKEAIKFYTPSMNQTGTYAPNEKTMGWWTNKQTECSKFYSNREKIIGKKWVTDAFFYSSTGIKNTHYKKNWLGIWKRKKVSEINFLLDQWSWHRSVVYDKINQTSCCLLQKTNFRSPPAYNKKKVSSVLDWVAVPTKQIAVLEFGRTHNWTTNYNNDCHNNPW